MRKFLTLVFCAVLSASSNGQILTKRDIAPAALTFVSGIFDGWNQALQHHYPEVDSKFNLNDQFWNPDISWTNKYKNGDPSQGAAYFGSTTFLAWTTDGYHMTRCGRNVTAFTAISIKIGDRQRWWEYLVEAVMYYLTYTVGFTFSYDYLFNQTEKR